MHTATYGIWWRPLQLQSTDGGQQSHGVVRTLMDTSAIISAFLRGFGGWNGCNWPTQFGADHLNLQGLKSSQALLMARSTAGRERTEWMAATRWLEQVERDAREAEEEACLAADLAILGQLESAFSHVERACKLECQYGGSHVWQPLQKAIASERHSGNGSRHRGRSGPVERLQG